jgi:hypothetical protein
MSNLSLIPFLFFLLALLGLIVLPIASLLLFKRGSKKFNIPCSGFLICSMTVVISFFPSIVSVAFLKQEGLSGNSPLGKSPSGELRREKEKNDRVRISGSKITIPSDETQKKLRETEKDKKSNKINNITFRLETKEKETVFIHSNRFYHPVVFGLEGERPRIVVDIKNTSYIRKGLSRILVNGNVIKQIRTYLHRDSNKLRVVLDLQPTESYKVTQTFYEASNSHVLELGVEGEKGEKRKEKLAGGKGENKKKKNGVDMRDNGLGGRQSAETMVRKEMIEGAPNSLKDEKAQKLNLRSVASDLRGQDIKDILMRYNFYSSCWNYNGDFCNPSGEFDNGFVDNGNGTVTDVATGLIWQKGGSLRVMTREETGEHIKGLNQKKFGGYTDWHLPTIEELASLMESSWKNSPMFMDPVFDNHHKSYWSSDTSGPNKAWKANFHLGFIIDSQIDIKNAVRAVRSLKYSKSL